MFFRETSLEAFHNAGAVFTIHGGNRTDFSLFIFEVQPNPLLSVRK